MRRIAWGVLTLLSSAACLCVLVLWARSSRSSDRLDLFPKRGNPAEEFDEFAIYSTRECVRFQYLRSDTYYSRARWSRYFRLRSEKTVDYGTALDRECLGFWYWNFPAPLTRGDADGRCVGVGIPYWFLTALTAVPPAFAARRRWLVRRLRRRASTGSCTQCGYDLRATPETCPECGAISCAVSSVPSPSGRGLG